MPESRVGLITELAELVGEARLDRALSTSVRRQP
jgi:hypothetical protein